MTTLNIGTEELDRDEIADKVESDIAFLTHRLTLLRAQSRPNPVILNTYEGMLESREAVLAWLLQEKQGNKTASNG